MVRSPDKPAASGLGVLLKSAGFSNAGDEIYAAHEYVKSRDALKELIRNDAVVRSYGNSAISIFNRFNPLGLGGSFEDLYDYYGGKVGVEYATTSAITTLTVRAFSPQDALKFNRQLLERAEELVNRLKNCARPHRPHSLLNGRSRAIKDGRKRGRPVARPLSKRAGDH